MRYQVEVLDNVTLIVDSITGQRVASRFNSGDSADALGAIASALNHVHDENRISDRVVAHLHDRALDRIEALERQVAALLDAVPLAKVTT